MSEIKDPAIRLFGATIPLKPAGDPPPMMPPCGGGCSGEEEKDVISGAASESQDSQEKSDPPKSLSSEFSEVPSDDRDEASMDKQTSEEQQQQQQDDEPSNPKGKPLKKPDKVLPCPRCSSMDTKFCYYNNYNVNQPRHFCKNCQRYWTAGGTMRNVPVGSGRRKNKNSNPFYRLMAHPPPHAARADAPDVVAYPLNPNGTVLRFGPDPPPCEPVASALNLAEKNCKSGNRNGSHQRDEKTAPPPPLPPEHSSPDSDDKAAQAPLAPPPCFSGSPLLYPPWISAPLCGPSFPIPFYPAAAYWSCTVAPVTWSTPLTSSAATAPANSASQGTGSSSPLGKHTREGDVLANSRTPKEEANNRERGGIWIPKTLRIHDPEEAAKSSIWSLIGARNSKADAVSGGGLFKGFQPDEDAGKNHAAILHANPAALSRSLTFHESSS